eukprot:gene18560-25069_t
MSEVRRLLARMSQLHASNMPGLKGKRVSLKNVILLPRAPWADPSSLLPRTTPLTISKRHLLASPHSELGLTHSKLGSAHSEFGSIRSELGSNRRGLVSTAYGSDQWRGSVSHSNGLCLQYQPSKKCMCYNEAACNIPIHIENASHKVFKVDSKAAMCMHTHKGLVTKMDPPSPEEELGLIDPTHSTCFPMNTMERGFNSTVENSPRHGTLIFCSNLDDVKTRELANSVSSVMLRTAEAWISNSLSVVEALLRHHTSKCTTIASGTFKELAPEHCSRPAPGVHNEQEKVTGSARLATEEPQRACDVYCCKEDDINGSWAAASVKCKPASAYASQLLRNANRIASLGHDGSSQLL